MPGPKIKNLLVSSRVGGAARTEIHPSILSPSSSSISWAVATSLTCEAEDIKLHTPRNWANSIVSSCKWNGFFSSQEKVNLNSDWACWAHWVCFSNFGTKGSADIKHYCVHGSVCSTFSQESEESHISQEQRLPGLPGFWSCPIFQLPVQPPLQALHTTSSGFSHLYTSVHTSHTSDSLQSTSHRNVWRLLKNKQYNKMSQYQLTFTSLETTCFYNQDVLYAWTKYNVL